MAATADSKQPRLKQLLTSQDTGAGQNGVGEGIPVAPKRIAICCDGTWQSSVSNLKNIPSNVTRLARSIARCGKGSDGRVWEQLVYYDAGIGTGDISNEEKTRGGGFGIGFVGNVIEAYNFIALNYNAGDEVFCFGFSRGAYTARAVAGLVNDIGIIAARDMQDFPDLYALYQNNPNGITFRKSPAYRDWVNGVRSKDASKEWDKPPHAEATESSRVVQAVGVFDTVGSLGIPDLPWTSLNLKFLEKYCGISNPGFHNVSLSPYIKHAFHSLALDEHRAPFSPTLWHFPLNDVKPDPPKASVAELKEQYKRVQRNPNATDKELSDAWGSLVDAEMYAQLSGINSELLQVWFPGVHINIGGGNDDMLNNKESDFEQIALISFAWMCEQVAPHLQFVDSGSFAALAPNTVTDRLNLIRAVVDKNSATSNGIIAGLAKNGLSGLSSASLTKAIPSVLPKAQAKTLNEDAVYGWATGPIVDSYSGTMVLAGSTTRTPGQYRKDENGIDIGPTNEFIHPSVRFRKEKNSNYMPPALSGFSSSKKMAAEDQAKCVGWEWKKGSVAVPEYLIKPGDEFSRHLACQDRDRTNDQAWKFIAKIDIDVGADSKEARYLNQV